MMIRIAEIPNVIFLTNGSTRTLDYNLPFSAHIEEEAEDVVKFSGTSLKDVGKYDMNEPLTLATENSGSTSISLDLFGLIPVKDIDVMVREEIMLYPGGQSIGVMLYTDGALVVGSSVVECADGTQINPSEAAGLEAGDIIRAVDGVKVENAKHLALLVNETKEHKLTLTVERDNMEKQLLIEAAEDSAGEWKLGVWVRDSTAGVGTLTFYDPESGALAGLGHAITDVDTGSMLRVKNGEIILSEVTEVVKGKEGEPGELKGLFDPREEVIGYISENTEFGIFGKGEMSIENGLCGPIPAGSRDELKEGEATIYASVDD
ncbi:MAG: PDZ domain-containing protein, partial [Christensenellaceae bacterium]|nr:PDZ domain-containing protein [Christensenellaceae bacterium]